MELRYIVSFGKGDPDTPPTMDEQIAIAREPARKLGVPNAESAPLYRVGRNSHTGEVWSYVEGPGRPAVTMQQTFAGQR